MGIKGIQYIRHLMKQIGLPDIDYPTPVLNDNRGSIDWIDSGCKPTKKLRHESLAELGIYEAKHHNEVSFHWIPGKTNPSDIFTKEDNDKSHYKSLRDLMVQSREKFMEPVVNRWRSTSSPTTSRWGVLEGGSGKLEVDEAEIDLSQMTKNTPVTSSTKIKRQYPPVQIATE